jgi:hypothetical protein
MKIIWIFLLKNESIYNFVWFWSTLLFFITEAEELPHLLIKHKRIVQLINEILGEDDHKTAERPTHTPLQRGPRRVRHRVKLFLIVKYITLEVTCQICVE